MKNTCYLISIVRCGQTKVKHGVPALGPNTFLLLKVCRGSPPLREFLRNPAFLLHPGGNPHRIEVAKEGEEEFPGNPKDLPEVGRAKACLPPKPYEWGPLSEKSKEGLKQAEQEILGERSGQAPIDTPNKQNEQNKDSTEG